MLSMHPFSVFDFQTFCFAIKKDYSHQKYYCRLVDNLDKQRNAQTNYPIQESKNINAKLFARRT